MGTRRRDRVLVACAAAIALGVIGGVGWSLVDGDKVAVGTTTSTAAFLAPYAASAKSERKDASNTDRAARSVRNDRKANLDKASRSNKKVSAQKCNDNLDSTLRAAGFRGESLRTAWAIVMRESKGQNLDESSPWYTGALGMWQIQTSAHSSKSWWSRSAMLDPDRQSRLVYLHLSNKGKDFRHWGIGPGGSTDTTFYGGWSSSQVWAWITEPYQRFYSQYPCD